MWINTGRKGVKTKLSMWLGWELGFVTLQHKRKKSNTGNVMLKKQCGCPVGKRTNKAKSN